MPWIEPINGWANPVPVERHQRRRRPFLVVALMAGLIMIGGCSQTEDLGFAASSTTLRLVDDDDLSGDATSASAEQVQTVVDRLLDTDDACAILTQSAIASVSLEPTALLSASARRVLAQGIVDIYAHVTELVPDPAVRPALQVQSNTFAQVLSVVDRYADSPNSARGATEIQTLSEAPDFVAASQTVSTWVSANC